jgi:hypothetical protein
MLAQNKGDYVRHIGFRLIPGTNNLNPVDAETVKKAMELPHNKYLLDKVEEIVVQEVGITDLTPAKAKQLVKDTFDLAVLEEWKGVENRKAVLNDIAKQSESIKNPPEDQIHKDE